jgi:hypothetical protein
MSGAARAGRGRVHVTNGVHAGSASLGDPRRFRRRSASPLSPRPPRCAASGCLPDVTVETASDLDGERWRGLGGSAAVAAATVGAVRRAERPMGQGDRRERRPHDGRARPPPTRTACDSSHFAWNSSSSTSSTCDPFSSAPTSSTGEKTPIHFERLELPKPLTLAIVATGRPAASAPRARRFVARVREAAAAGAAARMSPQAQFGDDTTVIQGGYCAGAQCRRCCYRTRPTRGGRRARAPARSGS